MYKNAIALVLFFAAVSPANAAADWQEYVFMDDEFAVQFPVPPTMSVETYETSITEAQPARTYSAEFDNILFKVRIVEIGDVIDQAANFVVEAAYDAMRRGNVVFNDFPRVGLRGNATFGVAMVVDTEDGHRIRSSFYSENSRLYLVEATVLPERGDLDQALPSRFEQTLRLRLDAPLNSEVPALSP
jgi:hypothetical protein